MDESLKKRIRFLEEARTREMVHSDRGLLDHLVGTYQLLLKWNARAALCDAGLFHSVYGTDHYMPTAIPISMRTQVQKLIGTEAEELAWIFCVMRRETLDENLGREQDFRVQNRLNDQWLNLSQNQFLDLINLSFANTLEAIPRLTWQTRRACRAYLSRFRNLAMPPAQQQLDNSFGQWWEFWK